MCIRDRPVLLQLAARQRTHRSERGRRRGRVMRSRVALVLLLAMSHMARMVRVLLLRHVVLHAGRGWRVTQVACLGEAAGGEVLVRRHDGRIGALE